MDEEEEEKEEEDEEDVQTHSSPTPAGTHVGPGAIAQFLVDVTTTASAAFCLLEKSCCLFMVAELVHPRTSSRTLPSSPRHVVRRRGFV